MHRGYIKIWRRVKDSGLYQLPNTLTLFIYMLTEATHKPIRYGTVDLERGQLVTGRHKLAAELEMSERSIRTALDHLIKLDFIASKATNKYTIYTIVNYGKYQDTDTTTDQQNDQQPTNKRPTNDQQPTTIQEHKHISTQEQEIQNLLSPPAAPKADPIPYERIVNLYHEKLPTLPKVAKLSSKRKGQIAARWRSGDIPDLETWQEYFTFVSQSDWLMGKIEPSPGRKRFVADLEWLTNESNFIKTWENKYHGR